MTGESQRPELASASPTWINVDFQPRMVSNVFGSSLVPIQKGAEGLCEWPSAPFCGVDFLQMRTLPFCLRAYHYFVHPAPSVARFEMR
jgi:hypothetical protein